MSRRWFITGGTPGGFGMAYAEVALAAGDRGVVTARRPLLPGMRTRGSGWIVNASSVAGLLAAVGFGHYSATKYAIEAVTDALHQEVAGPTSPSRKRFRDTTTCWTRSVRLSSA